jgi:hypothetical protein
LALGKVYKQLLAADGAFAEDTLAASTRALKSGSSGHDDVYTRIENALVALDSQRNSLTASMAHALLSAAFGGRTIDSHRARDLTRRGDRLLDRAASLAG